MVVKSICKNLKKKTCAHAYYHLVWSHYETMAAHVILELYVAGAETMLYILMNYSLNVSLVRVI